MKDIQSDTGKRSHFTVLTPDLEVDPGWLASYDLPGEDQSWA